MSDISISPLRLNDIPPLANLLAEQREEYMCGFYPFDFDRETLRNQLRNARQDRYWALFWRNTLAGFFMLRGLDEGYERPSFGVFVAEEYAGRGMGKAALSYALEWSGQQGIREVILKVEPENTRAASMYKKAGFSNAGTCPDTGQEIMSYRIK